MTSQVLREERASKIMKLRNAQIGVPKYHTKTHCKQQSKKKGGDKDNLESPKKTEYNYMILSQISQQQ